MVRLSGGVVAAALAALTMAESRLGRLGGVGDLRDERLRYGLQCRNLDYRCADARPALRLGYNDRLGGAHGPELHSGRRDPAA